MKKLSGMICIVLAIVMVNITPAYAKPGDMGFFGGITEGTRLPKTTEIILSQTNTKKTTSTESVYKEQIFLAGPPVEFTGILTVKTNGTMAADASSGTYKMTYDVKPGDTPTEGVSIKRTINFNVNWRREGSQIVEDYTVATWSETVAAGGKTFTLDPKQSHFDVSILRDVTPGVVYYKGDVSQKAVYKGDNVTTHEISGSIYGYDSAWSNTETHRLDGQVMTDDWQLLYQVRPSVSVNKTLQYSDNEPTAISFDGNYREVLQNKSGLTYEITVLPRQFYGTPTTGKSVITTYNAFEQLIAPDVSYLKGNFAEDDIRKLFSMQILDGDSKFYQPNQAITRGQFTTMLVKAIKLPIDTSYQNKNTKSKKAVPINIVFPDVLPERADYPYIMAAYGAGIAIGRGNGHYYADSAIEREEAFAIMLRSLGLSNLGLEPTPVTPYADDSQIADWAKKDVYAATRIGLIAPNAEGNINPKAFVSKAEAAAIINSLVEYMRTGLQTDYTEMIVNY